MSEILVFTTLTDLTPDLIRATQQTYIKFAADYSRHHEYSSRHAKQAQDQTIGPFIKLYKQFRLAKPILFVGCGSGRDLKIAESQGVKCVGIDISPAMLKLAKHKGVISPLVAMDLRHLKFPPRSFSGIFCESAITHTQKTDLLPVLNRFFGLLDPGGLVLVSLRLGTGKVFVTHNNPPTPRYGYTLPQAQANRLVSQTKFSQVKSFISPHPLPSFPRFITYLLQKPAP